jgi:hypothetical protein
MDTLSSDAEPPGPDGYQTDALQTAIYSMIGMGYNVIILSFIVQYAANLDSDGHPIEDSTYTMVAKDMAAIWLNMSTAQQQTIIAYADANQTIIMISDGGASNYLAPYTSDGGTAYGTQVATLVKGNNLHGLDFDLEAFGTYDDLINYVPNAHNAARNILGPEFIISHAPQAPYFSAVSTFGNGTSSGYADIYTMCDNIAFFNIQYYNQYYIIYTTYETIFEMADPANIPDNQAVLQIVNQNIPWSKIVVGKYMLDGAEAEQFYGNNGYVPPNIGIIYW